MKFSIFLLILTTVIWGGGFPEFTGKTLAGKSISLPYKNQKQLLILGFDMASADPMTQWVKKLNLTPTSNLKWLQVPVIGGVPPFVDGFIIGGMKRSVPEQWHSNYMPYFGGKKSEILNHIQGSDSLTDKATPFILLIQKDGNVEFSKQALATTENIQQFILAIEAFKSDVGD
ncbi:MAG: hypothetical protein VW397_04780 [Candidatus Margulisiibacteriota bacterium]